LGLDFIPPFASLAGWDILKGVNYASGSAGIRHETGKHTVKIKLNKLILILYMFNILLGDQLI